MGYPPGFNDSSCPQSVSTINVHETHIDIGGNTGRLRVETHKASDFDGTKTSLTLPCFPQDYFTPVVTINGVAQIVTFNGAAPASGIGYDVTIIKYTALFKVAVHEDDIVTIRYVHEV